MDVSYLNSTYIDSFLNLDKKVYNASCQVDKETTIKRLKRNPFTDIIVTEEKGLIGYISLCPVDDDVFEKIKEHRISEQEIEEKTLSFDRPGQYKAYLSSIVIDKENYPWFKGIYLFRYLQDHLKKFRKMGIFITEIVALAVTTAGRKTLERFLFKEVKNKKNIFIYNAEKNEALFIIEGQHFEALYTTIGKLLKVKWRSF